MAIYRFIVIRLGKLHVVGARLQRTLIGVLFFLSAAAMGACGLVSILGPTQEGIFSFSVAPAIGLLEPFFKPICIALGLLAMLARKSQAGREKTLGDLDLALGEIKTLSGLLPVCMLCKKTRNESGLWVEVKFCLREHTEASFSHGICPECVYKLYGDLLSGESGTQGDLRHRNRRCGAFGGCGISGKTRRSLESDRSKLL
jgi:hypothetical protein